MAKKLKIRLIALAVTVSLLSVLLLCFGRDALPDTRYTIAAYADGAVLSCTETVEFVSRSREKIRELCFSLGPNAYQNEENARRLFSDKPFALAYPDGFSVGRLTVERVRVDGKKADFTLADGGEKLSVPVKKTGYGKKRTVEISFSVQLPRAETALGTSGGMWNVSAWYPLLCPVRDGKTVFSPPDEGGKTPLSECADYTVTLNVPEKLRLAATGVIREKSVSGGRAVFTVTADNARSFAFALGEKLGVLSRTVGQTDVLVYFPDGEGEQAEEALGHACRALAAYGTLFGAYPYPTYSLVFTGLPEKEAAYPGLSMISRDLLLRHDSGGIEAAVAQTCARQWWQCAVGSDGHRTPWLGEGLTRYSAALYFEEVGGRALYQRAVEDARAFCSKAFLACEPDGLAINRSFDDYPDALTRTAFSCHQPVLMLDFLRTAVGREKLTALLKTYYAEHLFGLATRESFLASCTEKEKNAAAYLLPWLDGTVIRG